MTPHVDLYWIPLGAGGHLVRHVGRLYERLAARKQHREPRALFHSALIVHLPEGDFVIEQVPAHRHTADRGVVRTGSVGLRRPGVWPLPQYEVHCWRDGVIIDLAEAVESPVRVASDGPTCHRMLSCLADLPTPTWGRDELKTGEMWNSNSVTAWVLASSGVDADRIRPPHNGRAPGWHAGVQIARIGPAALVVPPRWRRAPR